MYIFGVGYVMDLDPSEISEIKVQLYLDVYTVSFYQFAIYLPKAFMTTSLFMSVFSAWVSLKWYMNRATLY